MKHIAKMKNNAARVVVAYRTVPNEPLNALVVGTQGLPDAYHDSLMQLVQDESGQQADELADILAVRKFPDGTNMLEYLHTRGHIKKVPTNLVLMTPNTQTTIQLDELNKIIAEQKGLNIDDLAITDSGSPSKKSAKKESNITVSEEVIIPATVPTPETLRSKADELLAEAKALRELADSLDQPKPKTKAKKVSVTA
jgi:hypothetical protein